MCRFVYYLGKPLPLSSLITEPTNSIIHQSFRSQEREEPLNGDGFGLAWYVDGQAQPALFRSIMPAWSNTNLRELARVTSSSCILAHVRAATQQLEVSEANCHPFKSEGLAFMHNGDIGGFARIRRALIGELSDESFRAIRGSTDSEHFFALVLDRLKAINSGVTCQSMARALEDAMRRVGELTARYAPTEHTYLNVVVTDGRSGLACRYTTDDPAKAASLYVSHGRRYVCEGNVCRMVDPDGMQGAVLVSSEPLSSDESWEVVPVNHMVLIAPNLTVGVKPVCAVK